MSSLRNKIFPLRLPQKFHGQQKPLKGAYQQYNQKICSTTSLQQVNPQTSKKIVNWQLKRLNKDIINQRREYLVHTGKISNDTPHWFQTTNNFYRRDQIPVPKINNKITLNHNKLFDVLGSKRLSLSDRLNSYTTDTNYLANRNSINQKHSSWNITDKVGSEVRNRSQSIHLPKYDVAGKIGSVEHRDFSVRKPQMKVGRTDFIDTYSPF